MAPAIACSSAEPQSSDPLIYTSLRLHGMAAKVKGPTDRLPKLLTKVTVAPASTQQHNQQQGGAFKEDEDRNLMVTPTSTVRGQLVARLALTGRFQLSPCIISQSLSRQDSQAKYFKCVPYMQALVRTFDQLQLYRLTPTLARSCLTLDSVALYLVTARLHDAHNDGVICLGGHREQRRDVADKLLSSVGACVEFFKMDSSELDTDSSCGGISHVSFLQALTQRLSDRTSSCETQITISDMCLSMQRAQRLIESLTDTSNHSLKLTKACKARRHRDMQICWQLAQEFHYNTDIDTKQITLTLNDAKSLIYSKDLGPVFLGTSRTCLKHEKEVTLSVTDSMHLLYLHLMLNSEVFYVHCTGSEHIVGE